MEPTKKILFFLSKDFLTRFSCALNDREQTHRPATINGYFLRFPPKIFPYPAQKGRASDLILQHDALNRDQIGKISDINRREGVLTLTDENGDLETGRLTKLLIKDRLRAS